MFRVHLFSLHDIDGLGRSRSEHDQSCVYSFKCELLRNIDGVDKDTNSALVVLACTNCPKSLDAALKRRFTRQIAVPLPTKGDRRDILNVICKKEKQTDTALLERVATHSEGMTGADLAALYNEACGHRLWTCTIDDNDIESISDGKELLKSAGPLTLKDWASSGRVHLTEVRNQNVSSKREQVSERSNGTEDVSK